ncbi:MAG TPA: DegT/DnrJ/EryC1/StrS family aminotransferase [Gemmatimonadaceae bacterium]|nr:DegT/DnrJ/EryC1/StrS family aminotransferase [Gemmatimonadaceae bacterium]
MPVPLLDLRAQYATIRDDVVRAMMKVVEDQLFILGAPVEQLEAALAALCHTKFAIGCANGSDALILALRALDIGRGDEVVTTPFTFFATGGTVHNVGAKPVFADIEPRTFNLDPAAASAAVTARTKAMIPVDLFGQLAPLECYRRLHPSLPLLEDAAQAIGARRRIDGEWVRAGERATIGTFSFFPSKNLGGYGDGGMLVTQDENLAARLRRLRTHGATTTYFHDEVGYNSRLDALQAAVLLAKLPHLERWSAARREHAAYYDRAFDGVGDIVTPWVDPNNESIYNQYTIRVPRRDQLQAHLKSKGIGNAIYYPLPLHLQKCFAYLGYREGSCPESERAAREVISLPVYPELTRAQQDEVIEAIRGFFGR